MGCCSSKEADAPAIKSGELTDIQDEGHESNGKATQIEEEDHIAKPDIPGPEPAENSPAQNGEVFPKHEASPENGTKTDPQGKIVKAMYDYTGLEEGDLSFKKDDRFVCLREEGGWWYARNAETDEEGYVPSTYVAIDDDTVLESHDWWFNMGRQEANKKLLFPGNPDGTFLVRESSAQGSYALSIRWFNPTDPSSQGIKHYKIRSEGTPKKFYINPKTTFTSLPKLINNYKENTGLCCKLLKACPNEPDPVPFKDIEIDRNSLKLGEKLGHGNFGDVYKAKWRKQMDVAVKTLKATRTMNPQEFMEEAETMHALRHRKLVLLYGVCSKEEPYYIVTEYMCNGSLKDFLKKDENINNIEFMKLMNIAAQVADGMSYLEEKQFVHRDVRAANMLVGENFETKVADFGLARVTSDEVYTAEGNKFPVKWTAPEAIHRRHFTVKSDVWSYGVLIYEILTYGKTPYPGMSNNEVISKLDDGYRMPKPMGHECPNNVYEKMRECWATDPKERPTFVELHKFFDKYETLDYEDEELIDHGHTPDHDTEEPGYDQ